MATVFEQILELKQRREEQAMMALHAARLTLEHAAQAVAARRNEAANFSRELQVRQTRLYDDLQTQVRRVQEIDEVRLEIQGLRAQEVLLYKKIDEAEQERRQAADEMETARGAHQQTVKDVEKFRQVVELERAEAASLEQAHEDNEIEESSVRLGEPAEF